jgi:signal transduction histidine kinase/DNA-binding LacI/PurR family transcriptional regulator/CheY-like chemotaxis protein
MAATVMHRKPTIGALAGWQFYRTATNLSYLAPIFRGMARAAQDRDCNLLLGCGMGPSASPTDPMRPSWPVPSPDQDYVPIGPWNTDGLIVAVPLHAEARSAYIQQLIKDGFPVLFVGSGETGPTIMADNTSGILQAMQHLVDHGHSQIAFIAGTRNDMRGDTGERFAAYEAGCVQFDLVRDPRLIAYGRHVYDGGYAAMQQIMHSGVPFTAVLASNDESALGAMQALQDAGCQIPEDVAMIGFDNRPEGIVRAPGLSSIHVPLFDIGYQAVEQVLGRIGGGRPLPDLVKVDTHLVVRESCGCRAAEALRATADPAWPGPVTTWHTDAQMIPTNEKGETGNSSPFVQRLTTTILNEAFSLTEGEALTLCQNLTTTFAESLRHGERSAFREALLAMLNRIASGGDDSHVVQHAITLLGREFGVSDSTGVPTDAGIHELVDEARMLISAHMRHQHRQSVVDERWTASRLSLLTARLLTALDEAQIYEILATHLPDMGIQTALLGLFEPDGTDPVAWTTLRNVIEPAQDLIHFPSQSFPPPRLTGQATPAILTLIPLVDQTHQIGFMVFDSAAFDLYGFIVQQISGALNTARLYREATEGRKLAEEANRMKSRFLSTISHELRTPLNLIVGLSSMVLRENDEGDTHLPEAARRDMERIHVYSQHLGGLIGDVIDLATSDAGQLRLQEGLVDLGEEFRLIAESGAQMAADKGLLWETNLPRKGPWVRGDKTRLRQVALNLINNAIKFTATGKVRFWLEVADGKVTVSVQDTGLGIAPGEQAAIFDEFRQSERTVTRGYGGLGLGLAISKRLIEMHGGTIQVASTGEEGAGSTFSFTLTAAPEPFAEPQRPPQAEPPLVGSAEPGGSPRVAVLTDVDADPARLIEHLRVRGFSAIPVRNTPGIDWHTGLDQIRPDAIIIDANAAAAIGWEMLRQIKSSPTLSVIPVLFFSASRRSGSLLELDFITKPIEISELTRALDQHWLIADRPQLARTILVVDDEPHTLDMHARIVQAQSASNRTLKARNGKEAVDLLHREVVDLVLLDLQMPEMDGFEVLQTMRSMEATRKIPVIIVTGKVLTEADMARLNQGVAAVLEKGLFSMDEVATQIGSALAHKRKISAEAQRLVRLAMAFIHENYAESLTRRLIAQQVGISEDHLTFCFRQELGTTPIEYLQRYRINQAKRLLSEGQQSITEIALNVGYSDSGYFSRIFHRETGMSPDAFRRS